jgi:UDP-glucose 4-epimerase
VGDVVAALIRLSDHPDAVGHVLNIGNDEEVTIRELAERAKAMTGSRSPIEFIDFTRAWEDGFEDIPRRVPDLPKIGRLIDYRPSPDLDNILGRIIEHERSR